MSPAAAATWLAGPTRALSRSRSAHAMPTTVRSAADCGTGPAPQPQRPRRELGPAARLPRAPVLHELACFRCRAENMNELSSREGYILLDKTVWRINIFALSSLQTRATVLLLTERSAPGPWLQRCSPHAQHAGLDAKVAVRMALTVLRRVDCAGVQQTVAVTVANMPSPSGRGCLTRIRGGMLSAVLLLLGEMAQVRGGAVSGLQSRNHPVVATAPTISVAGADFGTTSASFMVCARACLSACCELP